MRLILCAILLVIGGCIHTPPPKRVTQPYPGLSYQTALKELLDSGRQIRLCVFATTPRLDNLETALQSAFLHWGDSLSVIDRHNLDRVIEEQQLQYSGMVAEDTAVEAGRLAGLSHILLLSGEEVQNRRGGVTIIMWYKLLDVETGRIIAMDKLRCDRRRKSAECEWTVNNVPTDHP